MKKITIHVLIAFFLILFDSCSKDNFETGIKGTVEYGQGDCMPGFNYESREYEKYKGEIYFIKKEDLDSLGKRSFEQLKFNSISVKVKQGKLSAKLPIGTYLVMPKDVYLYSEDNTITITSEDVLNKNFKFWKCTSY